MVGFGLHIAHSSVVRVEDNTSNDGYACGEHFHGLKPGLRSASHAAGLSSLWIGVELRTGERKGPPLNAYRRLNSSYTSL